MEFTYKLMLAMAVSAGVTFAATPLVRKLAFKVGAIDVPKDERRVHTQPIPRLGGLAIFFGFLVSYLLFTNMEMIKMVGILGGGLVIVGTGVVDDIHPLRARTKLLLQIVSAVILYFCGFRIDFFTNFINPELGIVSIGFLSLPVTVFWIIGITNTVNLIDGLDGLAAGISSISAVTLTYVALIIGQQDGSLMVHMNEVAILTIIVAGACLGFLPYNFNPAKIFMGDAGSLFLGFILATASVEGALKWPTVIAFAIPILALGIPIFDTTFAIIRRALSGRPISEADKGHLHHRLMDVGMDQKRAVLTLYLIAALLGAGAVFLTGSDFVNGAIVLTLASLMIMIPIRRTVMSNKTNK